jgi:mannose-1-phosphate guanylyltransferase/mannose-6-phosphate isomerase
VVVEPVGRDTAPAILTAALMLEDTPEALMLVAPSDHVIGDAEAFRGAVLRGAEAARTGAFVTFGVAPDRPETGYGYLQLDGTPENGAAVPLKSFREKPDLRDRAGDAGPGGYLWNAGIFLMRVSDLIAAFETHAPDLVAPCRSAIETGKTDLGFFRLGAEAYGQARAISFDYAIMEKAERVMTVPLTRRLVGSRRLGHAVAGRGSRRQRQRARGPRTRSTARDSYLRSEDDTIELVGLGLRGHVSPWRCPTRSWWPTSPAPRT